MQDWIYQLSRMVETDFDPEIEPKTAQLGKGLMSWLKTDYQNPVSQWQNAAEKSAGNYSETRNFDR